MTTAQVVETPVTVNNNGPSQDYVHPDDQTQGIILIPCPFQDPAVLNYWVLKRIF